MTLNSDFFHGSGFRPLTAIEQVATSGYAERGGHLVDKHYVVVPSSEAHFFDFSQSREENLVVLAEGYNAIYGINYLYPINNSGGGLDGKIETPWDDIEFFEKSGVYLSYPSNYTKMADPEALASRVSPKKLPVPDSGWMSSSVVGFDGLSSTFSNASTSTPSNIISDYSVFSGYVHYLPDEKTNKAIEINYKELLYKINDKRYNSYVGRLEFNETAETVEDGEKRNLGKKNKSFRATLPVSGWFIKRQPWGPLPPPEPVGGTPPGCNKGYEESAEGYCVPIPEDEDEDKDDSGSDSD